jgi:hypothetical protein
MVVVRVVVGAVIQAMQAMLVIRAMPVFRVSQEHHLGARQVKPVKVWV